MRIHLSCLQLARVGRIKRPETLALACAGLRSEGVNITAMFAGFCVDSERERLLQKVPPEQHSGIRIVGQQDARSALWAADVTVLCSEREGFAISIVEAMMSGIVPVRTAVEGATDQISDGVTGFLFDVGDVSALADRLKWLMANTARSAEIATAARRIALERFGSDRMAHKIESVYRESMVRVTPATDTLLAPRLEPSRINTASSLE